MARVVRFVHILIVVAPLAVIAVAAEEVRFGYVLGNLQTACEAIGGKFGSAVGRCINRSCYFFGDCGEWASPAVWRDRIEIGDSTSKVIFWLGNPAAVDRDMYTWSRGKGGDGSFTAIIKSGRLVALDRS